MEGWIQESVSGAISQYQLVPLEQINISPLHRGTNEVFKVEAPGCKPVIFRKFGQCAIINRDTEHSTFLRVARAGLGPTCLSIGPGYRIEEFLSGHPMQRTEVDGLVEPIAKQIAKLHKLEQGSGMPKSYYFITEWSTLFERSSMNYYSELPSERRKLLDDLRSAMHEEHATVLAMTPRSDGLCLSHNDTSYLNFLVHDTGVHLIDYEYAGLSFPAFDLAMLTNEVMIEYFPNKPECFRHYRDAEISKERLNTLVETYSSEAEVDECVIWEQFYKCKALAQYGCFLWALCNYRPGVEPWFDLLRFAEFRLSRYKSLLDSLP